MTNHPARNDEAELVDRIGRVGHQYDVPRRRNGLRHVGEPLFGAKRDHNLTVRIEPDTESAFVIGRLSAPQPLDTARGGVAIGARFLDRLNHLLDDMRRCRHVRIAHAEVDNVGTARARLSLQAVDLFEDIGRQALDAVKAVYHGKPIWLGLQTDSPIARQSS